MLFVYLGEIVELKLFSKGEGWNCFNDVFCLCFCKRRIVLCLVVCFICCKENCMILNEGYKVVV